MMNKKAFVLLSGGIDSTTCLALAKESFPHVEAVSIDYGQRHIRETESAAHIAEFYNVPHTILNLRGIMEGANTMLTNKDIKVPDISYDQIRGVSPTYVPFRNGLILSALTAHAQKYVNEQIELDVMSTRKFMNAEDSKNFNDSVFRDLATQSAKDLVGIYFGAHAEDAHNWAYPDCTPEFIGSMANAIYIGSYMSIRLYAPFMMASKSEIIAKGSDLNVPYHLTWSCYKGEEVHCGTCPTCRARKQAFLEGNIIDPTEYAPVKDVPASMTPEMPF